MSISIRLPHGARVLVANAGKGRSPIKAMRVIRTCVCRRLSMPPPILEAEAEKLVLARRGNRYGYPDAIMIGQLQSSAVSI
jgi:hypothetical protein